VSRKKTVTDYETEATWVDKCLIHRTGISRKIYQLRHGKVEKGIEVCHTCDVGNCINDEHHFLGTHAENMRDAKDKGRMRHSEKYKKHMTAVFKVLWKNKAYRKMMLTPSKLKNLARAARRTHKGVPKTVEHKEKIRIAQAGKTLTPEHIENLIVAQKKAWAEGKYANRKPRKARLSRKKGL
jgi:hypothetical protein